MYKGNNRTACASQKQIASALLALLEDSSFQSVSVTAICQKAGISRQTFYSLFESKENVILYAISGECCFAPPDVTCRTLTLNDLAAEYSRYLISHRSLLKILVENDIIHFIYDRQYQTLIQCHGFLESCCEQDRHFLADFIASGMTSIARSYIRSGAQADETYLEKMICNLFSGSMIR